MRIRLWLAGCSLVALGAALGPASPAQADLADDVAALPVAAEQPAGYDRDLFGDHDRDAVLADNLADWPGCDGYYSHADDTCYAIADFGGDASVADDEVEVDHIVALREAWDSGAYDWTPAQLDEFAGDTANLWVMTAALNSSKGDKDPATWAPPNSAAVCAYLGAYVGVKLDWGLSVDEAEQAALETLAAGCVDGQPDPGEDLESLALTGANAPVLIGSGVVLLVVGAGLLVLFRRRGGTLTP